MPDLTNERIARMLGWTHLECDEWADPEGISHYDVPEFDRDLNYCLRDLAPEIVRRGYWLEICYGPGNTCVRLGQVGNGNALKTYVVLGDPPSIARAICEAVVWVVGKS